MDSNRIRELAQEMFEAGQRISELNKNIQSCNQRIDKEVRKRDDYQIKLQEVMETHEKTTNILAVNNIKDIGFIILDNQGALFGLLTMFQLPEVNELKEAENWEKILKRTNRNVLYRLYKDQSKISYNSQKRKEDYLMQVATKANDIFNDIDRLVVASVGSLKDDLIRLNQLELCKTTKIQTIEVQYGGDNGFSQAIEIFILGASY